MIFVAFTYAGPNMSIKCTAPRARDRCFLLYGRTYTRHPTKAVHVTYATATASVFCELRMITAFRSATSSLSGAVEMVLKAR